MEKIISVTFNKITKPNAIYSIWEVLWHNEVSKYRLVGVQHSKLKNIYSICNTETNQEQIVGNLESAKAYISHYMNNHGGHGLFFKKETI